MGSKSQRKKERHAKRRKEKRKERNQSGSRWTETDRHAQIALGGNARHRARLTRQVPVTWPGELPEDVAVFDDLALAALPPERLSQASAVRAALRDALESRGDDALRLVADIPRNSPFSEWRLFARGLVDWLADRHAAAAETWRRLDPERRPGRIATVMTLALRADLENVSSRPEPPAAAESKGTESDGNESASAPFDAQQLYHARLLRRVRYDRAALKVAEAGLKIPDEAKELLIGPEKIRWLKRFIEEYGETEPDLVAALAQTALGRAFAQDYDQIFDAAARSLPGPRHDRRNRLLSFFYHSRFGDSHGAHETAARALNEYLNHDLPSNETLSEALRRALACQIHLNEANLLARQSSGFALLDVFFGKSVKNEDIRRHLRAAIDAAPAHGPAYKAYVEWIESTLDNDRLPKPERTRLEDELSDVMDDWSQGAPDDVEPRLWLVDYLLENERLDDARPHVEFLAAARQDDPRVRATPWKWQVLEAMRLCRRKAWLVHVPEHLDQAEALWPAWLPKDWLPYLRAAWTLRRRLPDQFEDERQRICVESGRARDSLADACMMLGAAQRMRATAEEIQPLRAAVDRALGAIKTLPLADLLETAGIFWDLCRARLLYPAYRLHAKTIGTELFTRLDRLKKWDELDEEQLRRAALWGSEHRYWATTYEMKLPAFVARGSTGHDPFLAAAKLNEFLKKKYMFTFKDHKELGPRLRDAAPAQRDAFYRHWFVALADQLDAEMAKKSARFAGFPFGDPFEIDDDDDNDDLDFDPDCNCPDCLAARKRAEARAGSSKPPF